MAAIRITIQQLRGMIGLRVAHQGLPCEVIEILDDGPSLVLVDLSAGAIQIDQFGSPNRRAPQTYTVPVLTGDGNALHPSFLKLDLL